MAPTVACQNGRVTDPYPTRASGLTVPRGDVIGTYETYPEAQAIVDRLAKAEFDVSQISIVGNDLKTVERVTGKLSWGKAALSGAANGAFIGLFFALLLTLFNPEGEGGLRLIAAVFLITAGVGVVLGARHVRLHASATRLRVDAAGDRIELPDHRAERTRGEGAGRARRRLGKRFAPGGSERAVLCRAVPCARVSMFVGPACRVGAQARATCSRFRARARALASAVVSA